MVLVAVNGLFSGRERRNRVVEAIARKRVWPSQGF